MRMAALRRLAAEAREGLEGSAAPPVVPTEP